MSAKLDTTDQRIIDTISRHAKYSYREVASAAGISSVTALNRIKKLEEQGFIRRYTVDLDYDKCGAQFQAIVEIKSSGEHPPQLKRFLTNHALVSHVYRTSGEYDTLVIARFFQKNTLNQFVAELKGYETCQEVRSRIIMENIKEETARLYET